MANKQKQMLAVWGSPGGGKTVTAVKLALELSKRKKNVVLVFTDVTAPTLPAVVSEKKLPDVSVGELLAAPGMTQEQVLKTCVPVRKIPISAFWATRPVKMSLPMRSTARKRRWICWSCCGTSQIM